MKDIKDAPKGYEIIDECLGTAYTDRDVKEGCLDLAENEPFYAKKLYAWIIKEGKGNIPLRFRIARRIFANLKEIKHRHGQDDSYLLAFDEIYNWMIEK